MALSGCVSQVCGTTLHSDIFHDGWWVQLCNVQAPYLGPKCSSALAFLPDCTLETCLKGLCKYKSLCSCTGHNVQVMMHECINLNRDEMVQTAQTWPGRLRTPSSPSKHLLTTIAWTCESIVRGLHVSCLQTLIFTSQMNGPKHCLARRACTEEMHNNQGSALQMTDL